MPNRALEPVARNKGRHGRVDWQARPGCTAWAAAPVFPATNSQGDAVNNKVRALDTRRKVSPALDTPTDLSDDAVRELSAKLNEILADAFALYLKTKNFHWHVSGPHFRDYHLLLDEQSEQIFATTDDIAERVRKIGGTTLRSIGQISKLQTIKDNDESFVPAHEMLRELMNDNKHIAASMRECHELADKHDDAATAGLLENFIDRTERRTWFLFEASRSAADNARH
jgi:starvation-inducible DNA-binding protein